MSDPRSLAIQSVLYGNDPAAIIRTADSLVNAIVRHPADIGTWHYVLGDSGPTEALDADAVAAIGALVESVGGLFSYLPFGANLGHGGGHNRLAAETETDLLLFLNPDAIVAPETVGRMVAAFTDEVGAMDARQIPFEHPQDYDPKTFDASWASGSCLLTSRRAFTTVGGFDHENFFLYCDDVDYSWRVKLSGFAVRHQPAASIFHDKRLTSGGGMVASEAEQYYSREAALLLPYKWSRSDIVRTVKRGLVREAKSVEAAAKALAEFERREETGALPKRLDAQRKVGTFIGGNYAIHRF
jgi:GT2 family glycosyltransferase